MKKFICMLAVMGFMAIGTSGLALADAPAADTYTKGGKGINYPAYLYAKGQRGESAYKKFVRPAMGYDFRLMPQAAKYYMPQW